MKWRMFRRRGSGVDRLSESISELKGAEQFCPTPWAVARQMLEIAEAEPEDVVYDLGSGDGRIPILAAQEFGCRAVGIESDPELFRRAVEKVRDLRLEDRVRFLNQDFFQADLRPATVVTLYLLSSVNGQLQQRLASHLRAGSRVIALDYGVPAWQPETSVAVKSEGNVDYTLHLYRRRSQGAMWMRTSASGHAGGTEGAQRQDEGASQVS
jgi:SAM-dependent methyltransferase